jgi:peptide deformylase
VSYRIRLWGDPVLRPQAAAVDEIDGVLARIAEDMFPARYEAEGLGLAAPQVGIQKRMFVYDRGEGPQVGVNPGIVVTDGEWA